MEGRKENKDVEQGNGDTKGGLKILVLAEYKYQRLRISLFNFTEKPDFICQAFKCDF